MSAAHPNGPAIRRTPSPSTYPPNPNTVAQTIPPAALKMRNRIGGNPFAPASSAAKARSKATKRPKKTIFPPWRANRYRPRFLFRSSSPIRYPHRASNDVPNSRPTPEPIQGLLTRLSRRRWALSLALASRLLARYPDACIKENARNSSVLLAALRELAPAPNTGVGIRKITLLRRSFPSRVLTVCVIQGDRCIFIGVNFLTQNTVTYPSLNRHF